LDIQKDIARLQICLDELKRKESSETDSVKKSLVTLEIRQLQRVWASLLRQDFDDFHLDYDRPRCSFWV
jgi:low affinity Fe/Cu permease